MTKMNVGSSKNIEHMVADAEFETSLPHRDNPSKVKDNVKEIFKNEKWGIGTCDLVVANLNGLTTDDARAWELGNAHAGGQVLDWTSYPLVSPIRTLSH